MSFECQSCKQRFESEHDVVLYFDQDTNKPHYACHDCLIVAARPRRWMMKASMQSKMQAMEKKRAEASLRNNEDWSEAVKAMEERLGGASLADLEDGNEEAIKIAERALTKEWLSLHTDEINRGNGGEKHE